MKFTGGTAMTEIEVPIEQLQQDMEHAAHEASHGGGAGSGGAHGQSWVTWSALLSALLAVLAAVAALQAGHHVNEAMISQMKASDGWAYYQSKGIKANLLQSRVDILAAIGKEPPSGAAEKLVEYDKQQKEISEKAEGNQKQSEAHLTKHEIFAESVTFYQIAIAVTAIAVLARRRKFLYVSGVFGLIGLYYLVQGFLSGGIGGGGH
jgi:hypothetical protein